MQVEEFVCIRKTGEFVPIITNCILSKQNFIKNLQRTAQTVEEHPDSKVAFTSKDIRLLLPNPP